MFARQEQKKPHVHVYLAGPDVFMPNPTDIGCKKKQALTDRGFVPHFPMDPELDGFGNDPETASNIFNANIDLLNQSQIVLVNMTPWHGPSMDVGTVSELAYKYGQMNCGQPALIVGYYEGEVEKDFQSRAQQYLGDTNTTNEGTFDKNGNRLENFQLRDNLMIVNMIELSGGNIFNDFNEAVNSLRGLWEGKYPAKTEESNPEPYLAYS